MRTGPKTNARRDFIDAALVAETDVCILWPFAVRASSGYGAYDESVDGRNKSVDVHRYVCRRAHGDSTADLPNALHSCDTKLCINKRHLSWGSHAKNMADMVSRGRAIGGGRYRPWGDAARAAVLASRHGHVKTARELGLDVRHVARIRRG